MKSARPISFAFLFAGALFLAGPILYADVLEKTYDAANGLKVSVKTIAPYAQPADLQIVCVVRHKANGDTYLRAMKELDGPGFRCAAAARNVARQFQTASGRVIGVCLVIISHLSIVLT
jgi:hypothetical protein